MAQKPRIALLFATMALAATLGAGLFTQRAAASQLIDRNASDIQLSVNTKQEALITYRVHGVVKHVLAWGAINAIAPTPGRTQVAFKLDYAGGWGKYHTNYWKSFANACKPYTGPALAWKVTACTAPDGSYWALQAWQRARPDLGKTPNAAQSVWELRLSHWTGPLPVLSIQVNWAYKHFDHLFGTLTYDGTGVYGFRSTPGGAPLDTFGRNIYVDTFNSAYGSGWKRENSFLAHKAEGAFCYGFYPHGSSPAGTGTNYRATTEGPGVTPDVMWTGAAPGPYNPAEQAAADDQIRALGDSQCKPV
jgi:hypothetical protein